MVTTSSRLVVIITSSMEAVGLVEIIYIGNGNHQLQAGGDYYQQYGGSGAGGDYLLSLN